MTSRHIVSCIEDRKIHFHNVETGVTEHRIDFSVHCWEPQQIAEDLVATSADNNTVVIWNTEDRSSVKTLSGHSNDVRGLSYIPGPNLLASGGQDHDVRIWNLESGDCEAVLQGHTSTVYVLDHLPFKDLWVFSAGDDDKIRAWDIETKQELHCFNDHGGDVDGLTHCDEKQCICSGSDDDTCRLFDVNTWDCVQIYRQVSGHVRSVCFRQEKFQLCAACNDGNVFVFDVRNPDADLNHWSGHSGGHSCYGSCDVQDRDYFITTSWDEWIRAWKDDGTKVWEHRENGHDPRGVCPIYTGFDQFIRGSAVALDAVNDREHVMFVLDEQSEYLERCRLDVRLPSGKRFKTCRTFFSTAKLETQPEAETEGEGEVDQEKVLAVKEATKEIAVSVEVDVDPEVVVALLTGNSEDMRHRTLVEYFAFFIALGMKKRAFLLADGVKRIRSPKMLVYLAAKAWKKFEMDQPEESPDAGDGLDALLDSKTPLDKSGFTSPFTLSVFNRLKDFQSKIVTNRKMALVCEKYGFLGRILSHEKRPVCEHVAFGYSRDDLPKSFEALLNEQLSDLYKHPRIGNVTLVSNDGIKIKAHLDVFLLKTRMMMPMLRFDGIETEKLREDGEIHFRSLSGRTLADLMRLVYSGELETHDFSTLLELFHFASTYVEESMIKGILAKFKDVAAELKEVDRLKPAVMKAAPLISRSDALIDLVAKMCGYSTDRLTVILQSYKLSRVSERLQNVEDGIGSRITQLEVEMTDVEKRAAELLARVRN